MAWVCDIGLNRVKGRYLFDDPRLFFVRVEYDPKDEWWRSAVGIDEQQKADVPLYIEKEAEIKLSKKYYIMKRGESLASEIHKGESLT